MSFEGYYVCENVGKGGVKPCFVNFFGENCGGVCKHDGRLLIQCERVPCWLVTVCEYCGKGAYKIVGYVFSASTLEQDMYFISSGVLVAVWA